MNRNATDKQAYMNATPMQREVVRRLLCDVLACLRASYLSYQTSHWQVVGQSSYGNHLLFARLYESVKAQVDQLAEKLVGYLGREVVDLNRQAKHIAEYCRRWHGIDCHHKRGLQSEADLQQALKRAYEGIKQVNAMSLGLDDWIMATANAHEENEYLLQQALTPVPGQKQASSEPNLKVGDIVTYTSDFLRKTGWVSDDRLYGKITGFVEGRGFHGLPIVDWEHKTSPSPVRPENIVAVRRNGPGQGYRRGSSGAPSAEKYFFDNPEKREVREFADTGAISNDPSVALDASREEQLDTSPAKAVAEAEAAPPTPQEIAEEPGAGAVSTLNRFVVDSEDPEAEEAVPMNEKNLESKKLLASWVREIERRESSRGNRD